MNYIMSRERVTIFHNGQSYSIHKDHHNYPEVVKILADQGKDADGDVLLSLVNAASALVIRDDKFSIEDGVLYFEDMEISNGLVTRISNMSDAGQSVSHLEAFLKNLMRNPSETSIMELYEFLENNSLPITEDGYFLAYKRVRNDFTDIHSGTFDNSVGQTVKIERSAVDDDRNRTCSFGLHACSWDYLSQFSSFEPDNDRVVIVKINPKDVVSVPSDYDNAKLRCAGYQVIAEIADPSREKIKSYAVDTTAGDLIETDDPSPEEFDPDSYFDAYLDDEDEWDDEEDEEIQVPTNSEELWQELCNMSASGYIERGWWKLQNGDTATGYVLLKVPAGEPWKDYLEYFIPFPLNAAVQRNMFIYRSVPKSETVSYELAMLVRDDYFHGKIETSKPRIYAFNAERLNYS